MLAIITTPSGLSKRYSHLLKAYESLFSKAKELGMVAHSCNLSIWGREMRQEDHEFKGSLGFTYILVNYQEHKKTAYLKQYKQYDSW